MMVLLIALFALPAQAKFYATGDANYATATGATAWGGSPNAFELNEVSADSHYTLIMNVTDALVNHDITLRLSTSNSTTWDTTNGDTSGFNNNAWGIDSGTTNQIIENKTHAIKKHGTNGTNLKFKPSSTGKYILDITDVNMTAGTANVKVYKQPDLPETLYIGMEITSSGWTFGTPMESKGNGVFEYTFTNDNKNPFYFLISAASTSTPTWSDTEKANFYGPESGDYEITTANGRMNVAQKVTKGKGNVFKMTEDGTYKVTVNLTDATNGTVTVSPVQSSSASYCLKTSADNWNTTIDLTGNGDGTYSCTMNNPAEGLQFMVQKNGSDFLWPTSAVTYSGGEQTINLGTTGGQNITMGRGLSGKYTITLNPSTMKLTVSEEGVSTFTKVYLVGDVTGGWETSKGWEFATTDGVTYTLTGKDIKANKNFKIYAGESWLSSCNQSITVPYNDTLIDGSGTDGSKNMRLSSNANGVNITFNLSTKAFSITQSGGAVSTEFDYYIWANFIQNTGAQWSRADFAKEGEVYTTRVFKATANGEMEWGMKKKSDNNTWYRNKGQTAPGVWNNYVIKTESENNKFISLLKDHYYRIEAEKTSDNTNINVRIVEVTPAKEPWNNVAEPRLVLYAKNSANGDTWYEYDFSWNRIYGAYCAYITAKTDNLETYIKGMNVNNYLSRYGVAADSDENNLLISSYNTSGDKLYFANNCLVENGKNINFTNIETGRRYRVELQMYENGTKARLRYFLESADANESFNPANGDNITFHWQYKNSSDVGDGHNDSNNWTRQTLVYDPERNLYTLKLIVQASTDNSVTDSYYVKHSNDGWNFKDMTQINGKFYYTLTNAAGTKLALSKNKSSDVWPNQSKDRTYDGTSTKTFDMTNGASDLNIEFASTATGTYCLTYDPDANTLTIEPGQAPATIKGLNYVRYTLEKNGNSDKTYKRITAVPVDVWNAGCLWTDNNGNADADNPDFTFEGLDLTAEAYEVQMRYNSEIGEADIRLVKLSGEVEPTKYYIVGEHINGWNYAEPAEMTEEVEGAVYSYYTWLWKQGTTGHKPGFRISNSKGSEDEFNTTYYGPVQAEDFLVTSGVAYTYNVGNRPDNMGTWQVTNSTENGEDYYRIEVNVQTGKITVTNVTPGITAEVSLKASDRVITYDEAKTITREMPAGASVAEPIYFTKVNEATAKVSISPATETATEELLSFTINGHPVDVLPTFNESTKKYEGEYGLLPAPNVNGRYIFAARFKVTTADGTSTIKNAAASVDATTPSDLALNVTDNRFAAVVGMNHALAPDEKNPDQLVATHCDAYIEQYLQRKEGAAALYWYPGYDITLCNEDGSKFECSEIGDDVPSICDDARYSWLKEHNEYLKDFTLTGYTRPSADSDYSSVNDWGLNIAGQLEDIAGGKLKVIVPCFAKGDPTKADYAKKYTYDITANYPFLSKDGVGGVLNTGVSTLADVDTYTVTLLKAHTTGEKATSITNIVTEVRDILDENIDANAVYYNLQGQRVVNPEKGLYIVVKGNKTYKVMIK